MTKQFMGKALAAATTVAMFATATPAFAYTSHGTTLDASYSNNISVSNSNSALVVNSTVSSASTGDNYATGGNGGKGGNGGNGGNAGSGYGGNGADAGMGGNGGHAVVVTGDAHATAVTENDVNQNGVEISVPADCGCGVDPYGFRHIDTSYSNNISVANQNEGAVLNLTGADASTGGNSATGGKGKKGGNGGNGGNVEGYGKDYKPGYGGDAGMGGNGGMGGDAHVMTGFARSEASTINVVNTNLVKITKGN